MAKTPPMKGVTNVKGLVSVLNKSLTAYVKIAKDYVNNAGDDKEREKRAKILLGHISKSELKMLGPKKSTSAALTADDVGSDGCPNCPPGFECTDQHTCTPAGGN